MRRRMVHGIVVVLAVVALSIPAAAASAAPTKPTLVDVAIAVNSSGPYAAQFDTLLAAVLAADPAVLATLTGRGQVTVFAPTDEAFAKLGLTADTISSLDQATLTHILLYHVVKGRRMAEDVLASDRLRTVQGGILRQSGGVLTDQLGREATIIVTDVEAGNGVIHAIDTVVLPFAP